MSNSKTLLNINNNTIYNNAKNYNINFNNKIIVTRELDNSLLNNYSIYKKFFNDIKEIVFGKNVECDINSELNQIINEIKKLKALTSMMVSKNIYNTSSEISFSIFHKNKNKNDKSNLYICRVEKDQYFAEKKNKTTRNKIVRAECFRLLPIKKFQYKKNNSEIKNSKEKAFSKNEYYKKINRINNNNKYLREDFNILKIFNETNNNNNNNNYLYTSHNFNNYHLYYTKKHRRMNKSQNKIIERINKLKNEFNIMP